MDARDGWEKSGSCYLKHQQKPLALASCVTTKLREGKKDRRRDFEAGLTSSSLLSALDQELE